MVDQLLVLLLVLSAQHDHWIESLSTAVERWGSEISGEQRAYLRAFVVSAAQLSGPATIRTEGDALRAVEKFVGGLAFHGRWLYPLNAISDWVSQRKSERDRSDSVIVREKVKIAASAMRTIVLPAVEALLLLSKLGNVSTTSDLEEARAEVIHNLNFLTEFVDSIGEGEVGAWAAQSVEDLWGRIQDRTFRTSPDLFLGKLRTEEPSGVFERIMQRLFSSPSDIIRHLVRAQFPGTMVKSDWEQRDVSPSMIVTPYSVEAVTEICRLLLQDMVQHGVAGSSAVMLSIEEFHGRTLLVCQFENLVKENDTRHGGRSQARVQALASEHRMVVGFDSPRRAGERYSVRVELSGAIYVRDI